MRYPLTGWIRQKYDPRDWHFIVPRRTLARLAPTIDLQPHMGPYLDQGDLGSCGPNTAAECWSYDQAVQGLAVATISRLQVYWHTRSLMGTTSQDSGVDNRTMLKALAQFGAAPEALWPYDTSKFAVQPPANVVTAAAQNKISNYAAVVQSADQMKGTVSSGFPFVFGFDVFQQIESDEAAQTGLIRSPAASESPIGGHDMTLCGFTDADRPGVKPGNKWPAGTFKLRQHWTNADGSPWGDGGYGYVPYDYALSGHAGDFWVINAIPGSPPVGPPPVPPDPAPPAPVPPMPAPLFTLRTKHATHEGQDVVFRSPKAFAAGDYGWVPLSAALGQIGGNALSTQAIHLSDVLSLAERYGPIIWDFIQRHGPEVVVEILSETEQAKGRAAA